MRRFGVWLWKEWRDHRAVLIGIAIALPVLTAAAFLAFPDRIGDAVLQSAPIPAFTVVPAADVSAMFLLAAVAIALLAVSADLFGAEAQRGTLDLVRRTPRGLGLAFGAKVAFLALALAGVVLWEAVVLAVAWALSGRAPALDVAVQALQRPPTLYAFGGGFALGLWIAAVSTWIPRSAAAVGAALLLLGALAVPGVLMLTPHPPLARALSPEIPAVLAGLGLLGLAAAAVSFLRGLRLRRGSWSAAWRGLAVVLVVATGGYAYGAARLAAYLDYRPGDEDVWLDEAVLGAEGRWLFVNAWRGIDPGRRGNGTPPATVPARAFAIDLVRGTLRPLGPPASWIGRVNGAAQFHHQGGLFALEPAPVLACRHHDGQEVTAVAWIDGRTAELRKVYPPRFFPPDVVAWLREGLAASTRVRDAEGRRAWLRPVDVEGNAVVEAEGRLAPDRPPREMLVSRAVFSVPQGWFGFGGSDVRQRRFLDATTGREATVATPGGGWPKVLSTRRWIRREERAKRPDTGTWLVGEVATGTETPALRTPEVVSEPLDVDRALALRGAEEDRRLVLWDPATGRDEEIVWSGEPLGEIADVQVLGRRADTGACLLNLVRRRGPMDRFDSAALAVLDVAARSVRVLRSWTPSEEVRPIALTDDGALLVLEDGSRVVRIGPERDRREMLLPR